MEMHTSPSPEKAPAWALRVLLAAGIYNVLWGAWVVLFPHSWFHWLGMESPRYPELWQCIGMIVGCYGIGYAVAAFNPLRHWPIILVGLIGKVAGPIGFIQALVQETLPIEFAWMILFNDLIWWVPFSALLLLAYKHHLGDLGQIPEMLLDGWQDYKTENGHRLGVLAQQQPILLIFLRHSGCTFCREMLHDLAQVRNELSDRQVLPVLVHMSAPQDFQKIISNYQLHNVEAVSDPERGLYRAFGLGRGNWVQLFGFPVWQRGWEAGVKSRQGVGMLDGDGFQMPGVFLIDQEEIRESFVHTHAGEKPDYLAMVNQAGLSS
jgi:hypothetical protein